MQQAAAGIHKVREMLIKQRTMLINTLRGLMAEFGTVVAEGPHHVSKLVAILADPADRRIPTPLREGLLATVGTLRGLERRIEVGNKRIVGWGRDNQTRHLITIPAIDRSCPVQWQRSRSTPPLSAADGTSLRRWSRGRTAWAARSSSVRSASAAMAICAWCWSTARCRCCAVSKPRRIPSLVKLLEPTSAR